MKNTLLVLLLLSVAQNSYAGGPQIFGGYQTTIKHQYIEDSILFGFQYAWLKTSDGNWQFIAPGFGSSWSLQLVGRRFFKGDRQKWVNPADAYLGVHITGNKGLGVSLSLGW